MFNELFLRYLFMYGFFILLIGFSLLLIVVVLNYDFIKHLLTARFSKNKSLEVLLNNDGSLDFSVVKRGAKGLAVDKNGDYFQDYERKTKNGETKLERNWYFYRGLRWFFKRENDIPAFNIEGKPAPLDMPFLSLLRNLDRERILKRNKLLKDKARSIPILLIIGLMMIAIIGFFIIQSFL